MTIKHKIQQKITLKITFDLFPFPTLQVELQAGAFPWKPRQVRVQVKPKSFACPGDCL